MDIYVTESEQIEQIKEWWKKYGSIVVVAIFIFLAATLGWRIWQQRHERMLEKASVIYERLLNAVANNDSETMQNHAARLIDHYRYTPYAQLAALMLARQAVYNGQLDVAAKKLQWIMKHGRNKSLRQLARIRAARVLLAERQAQKAFDLLQSVDDAAYTSVTKEVMGDALLALGKADDARQAYNDALKALPDIQVMQPLLQMKLDDLANPTGPTVLPLAKS